MSKHIVEKATITGILKEEQKRDDGYKLTRKGKDIAYSATNKFEMMAYNSDENILTYLGGILDTDELESITITF